MAHSEAYENKGRTLSEVFDDMEDDDEIDDSLLLEIAFSMGMIEDE